MLISTFSLSLYSPWLGLLGGGVLSVFLLLHRFTSNSIVVEETSSSVLVIVRSLHTEQQVEEMGKALLSSTDLANVTLCLSWVEMVSADVGKCLAKVDSLLRGQGGFLTVHVSSEQSAKVVRELAPYVNLPEDSFPCCDRTSCDKFCKSDNQHQHPL